MRSDPDHERFRQQFIADRQTYYEQGRIFLDGKPTDCDLSPEFLAQFAGQKNSDQWVEVLEGQCEGGEIVGRGRVRIQTTYNSGASQKARRRSDVPGPGEMGPEQPRRPALVSVREGEWQGGNKVGEHRHFTVAGAPGPAELVFFYYFMYDEAPAPVRNARFMIGASAGVTASYGSRGESPNVVHTEVLTSNGTRYSASSWHVAADFAAAHGPAEEICYDFGRETERSGCSALTPPTQGAPADALRSPSAGGPDRNHRTLADVIDQSFGGSVRLVRPGDPEAYQSESTDAPIETAMQTEETAANIPQDRCDEAGSHQADVVAAKTPSLNASLRESFTSQCRTEHWSTQRTECVLAARSSPAIEACGKATAPAKPRRATKAECSRAAKHQARVMSRQTPSMEASFADAFRGQCNKERWSDSRTACVLLGKRATDFEECGKQ